MGEISGISPRRYYLGITNLIIALIALKELIILPCAQTFYNYMYYIQTIKQAIVKQQRGNKYSGGYCNREIIFPQSVKGTSATIFTVKKYETTWIL